MHLKKDVNGFCELASLVLSDYNTTFSVRQTFLEILQHCD